MSTDRCFFFHKERCPRKNTQPHDGRYAGFQRTRNGTSHPQRPHHTALDHHCGCRRTMHMEVGREQQKAALSRGHTRGVLLSPEEERTRHSIDCANRTGVFGAAHAFPSSSTVPQDVMKAWTLRFVDVNVDSDIHASIQQKERKHRIGGLPPPLGAPSTMSDGGGNTCPSHKTPMSNTAAWTSSPRTGPFYPFCWIEQLADLSCEERWCTTPEMWHPFVTRSCEPCVRTRTHLYACDGTRTFHAKPSISC